MHQWHKAREINLHLSCQRLFHLKFRWVKKSGNAVGLKNGRNQHWEEPRRCGIFPTAVLFRHYKSMPEESRNDYRWSTSCDWKAMLKWNALVFLLSFRSQSQLHFLDLAAAFPCFLSFLRLNLAVFIKYVCLNNVDWLKFKVKVHSVTLIISCALL